MDNQSEPKVLNLADASSRILAFIIDIVIFVVISAIVGGILAIPFVIFGAGLSIAGSGADNARELSNVLALANGNNLALRLVTSLASTIVWLGYFVFVPSKIFIGQTLGKKILKVKIVRSNGNAVDMVDMFKRNIISLAISFGRIVPILGACFCCIWFIIPVINVVLLFTDAKRQTLNDKIADTVVIEA